MTHPNYRNERERHTDPVSNEIDQEFNDHIERAVADLMEAGLTQEQAIAQAHKGFGDTTSYRSQCIEIANQKSTKERVMDLIGTVTGVTTAMAAVIVIGVMMMDSNRASADTAWERIAPFEGIVWRDTDEPVVLVSGKWYNLMEINGTPVDQVIDHSIRLYARNGWKRFNEDMYELLTHLQPEGDHHRVDLKLMPLDSDEPILMTDVVMTHRKRESTKYTQWRNDADIAAPPADAMIDPRSVEPEAAVNAPRWRRTAPFEGVVWRSETQPVVLISGRWHELHQINNTPVEQIMERANHIYKDRTWKRFTEDLHELLIAVLPDIEREFTTVDLTITPVGTDERIEMTGVPMTRDNRRAAKNMDWRDNPDVTQPPTGTSLDPAPAITPQVSE